MGAVNMNNQLSYYVIVAGGAVSIIFLIALILGHWHPPGFNINMTEDFWGRCV